MKFLLFDREENYISTLKDVLEARHTEEINGEDVLNIATLDKSIGKGYKLVYKDKYGYWKEFIVKEIEESHTNDGIEKRLFCESSFYETFGDYIEDKRPSGTANHALSVALEPTRWEVGIVDNLGTNTASFYQISAKEAVQKLAETWKGEIRTRVEVAGNKVVHRYVDILERRGGDFGQRFTYSKNLESVTKIIHRNDVITALYGYGKGEEVGEGHGRRIDFASINDGKAYVENLEAKEIWGRPNGDGTKSHVFDKVYFDNCEDKQELLQLTTEKLEEVSSPLITYEAKAIDLGGADLGDSVAVIDTEFTPELRLKARVIKIVRDLLKEENNNLVLGNFIPSIIDSWNKQEEFINNFRSKQGVWDRADTINDDGTINAQFLNNLVDELNQKMNAQGGYVYISEDGKGLTTYDKPLDQSPTMAIQLLGGAFRIANSKLPNGEFDWRSFGTGAGFTADEFVAGVLRGGKVHFDLTNGTFLIGDSIEDYNFYFDGNTLKIRTSSGKTIEESLQEIQEEVDGLEIGGENRLFDSRTNIEFFHGEQGRNLTLGTSMAAVDGETKSGDGTGLSENVEYLTSFGSHTFEANQPYTLSFDLKADSGLKRISYNRLLGSDGQGNTLIGSIEVIDDNIWRRYSLTFSFPIERTGEILIATDTRNPDTATNVPYSYRAEKLEKGSVATPWTPAPEDPDGGLDIQLIRGPGKPYYKVFNPHGSFVSLAAAFPNSRFAEPLGSLGRVTVSLDVMVDVDRNVTINGATFPVKGNRWTKIHFSKNFDENTTKHWRVRKPFSRKRTRDIDIGTKLIEQIYTDINTLYYRNLQVEKGNVPTDHNLTPEELEGSITRTNTELKQLSDSISLIARRNENTGRFEVTPEAIVAAINTTDGVGRVKNVGVTIDEYGLTVENGALIVRDARNAAIITSDGLKALYVYASTGLFNGWDRMAIYEAGNDFESYTSSVIVYIPEDFIISKATLIAKSLPSFKTNDPDHGAPDGYYHPRNLRVYSANLSSGVIWVDGYSIADHPDYPDKVNVTNEVWGEEWSPTGSTMQTKTADISSILTTGDNVLLFQTGVAHSYSNLRYFGLFRADVVIEGYLRG